MVMEEGFMVMERVSSPWKGFTEGGTWSLGGWGVYVMEGAWPLLHGGGSRSWIRGNGRGSWPWKAFHGESSRSWQEFEVLEAVHGRGSWSSKGVVEGVCSQRRDSRKGS